MAEATQFLLDYQEVVELIIKKQGIHEGRWRLMIEFGFQAQNFNTPEGVRPGTVNLLQRIGITKTDEVNNLTVDAAEVNPAPAAKKTASKRAVKSKK